MHKRSKRARLEEPGVEGEGGSPSPSFQLECKEKPMQVKRLQLYKPWVNCMACRRWRSCWHQVCVLTHAQSQHACCAALACLALARCWLCCKLFLPWQFTLSVRWYSPSGEKTQMHHLPLRPMESLEGLDVSTPPFPPSPAKVPAAAGFPRVALPCPLSTGMLYSGNDTPQPLCIPYLPAPTDHNKQRSHHAAHAAAAASPWPTFPTCRVWASSWSGARSP